MVIDSQLAISLWNLGTGKKKRTFQEIIDIKNKTRTYTKEHKNDWHQSFQEQQWNLEENGVKHLNSKRSLF